MPTQSSLARRSLLALCLLSAVVHAQGDNAIPDGAPPGISRIDQADLKKHAEHLASDELGGRYTGMPGQIEAAEYIKNHFEALGLLPLGDKARGKKTYLQHYPLERTYLDPKKTSLVFGGKTYKGGFAVLPGKGKKPTKLSGQFVYCGTGNPRGLPKGFKRKIPVVVIKAAAGGPRASMRGSMSLNRTRSVNRELAGRGAKVVVFLVLDKNSGLLDAMNTTALLPEKHSLVNPRKPGRAMTKHNVPSVFLPPEKSKLLLSKLGWELSQGGKLEQVKPKARASGKVNVWVRVDKKFRGLNVCAYLEGTSKKSEAIVFSAHMDHMGTRMDGDAFNGADDNASGSSGLLEIAEAFAKSQPRPKRSIIFLSVSGEELGLWGSLHYSEKPTWPLKKIVANINIDMIGRNTELSPQNAVSVTPSRDHAKFSTVVRESARLAEKMGMTLSNGDTYYRRSDHYNFARKGVPVVFFCDGEHADYHKVTDHADRLDFAKMKQITRLAFWTGWNIAGAKGRPKNLGRQASWTK